MTAKAVAREKVEAVIKPFKVDAVKEARSMPGDRPHLQRGEGVGRQKGHTEMYRGSEYQVDLVPKVKVELVVPDELVSRVMRALQHAARTGTLGDGKISSRPWRRPCGYEPESGRKPVVADAVPGGLTFHAQESARRKQACQRPRM